MYRFMPILALVLGLTTLGATRVSAETRSFGVAIEAGGGQVEVAQRDPAQRPRPLRQWRLPDRRGPSQEPASARGYTDGYRTGLDDGRDRDRYNPLGNRNYRSGDLGYSREYGTRDAYRNNYRAGFRQGYEDGFRDGSRGRR
ncbi:MAG: hypothetical protein ABL986_08540 [Vicinamibacterales bacterium]